MKVTIASCLIFLSLTSWKCSEEASSLTGVKWEVESLYGKEVKLKDKDNRVYLTLDDKEQKVHGKAGCNSFFGIFEIEDGKLVFSKMGATKMACSDMDTETLFFKALEEASGYTIKSDKLSLKNENGVVAVLKAKKDEHVE